MASNTGEEPREPAGASEVIRIGDEEVEQLAADFAAHNIQSNAHVYIYEEAESESIWSPEVEAFMARHHESVRMYFSL